MRDRGARRTQREQWYIFDTAYRSFWGLSAVQRDEHFLFLRFNKKNWPYLTTITTHRCWLCPKEVPHEINPITNDFVTNASTYQERKKVKHGHYRYNRHIEFSNGFPLQNWVYGFNIVHLWWRYRRSFSFQRMHSESENMASCSKRRMMVKWKEWDRASKESKGSFTWKNSKACLPSGRDDESPANLIVPFF